MTTNGDDTVKPQTEAQELIPKTPHDLGLKYLGEKDQPAIVVYETVNLLMDGADYALDSWEPESIWLELTHKGFKPSEQVRNQILCCSAVKVNHDVLTSQAALQNIVLALSGEIPNVEMDEQVDVEQLAWGMVALNLLLPDRTFTLDYEPIEFIARQLAEEGFVVAPPALGFAQARLEKQLRDTSLVHPAMRAIKDPKTATTDTLKVQVAKSDEVGFYVKLMYDEHESGMADVKRVRAARRRPA